MCPQAHLSVCAHPTFACVLLSSLYRDIAHIPLGPTAMIPFTLATCLEVLFPDTGTFCGTGFGDSAYELGVGGSPIQSLTLSIGQSSLRTTTGYVFLLEIHKVSALKNYAVFQKRSFFTHLAI